MRLSFLLTALGLAAQGLGATMIDALDLLYFWTVYDLDVAVYGVGKGYIALGCRGTGADGRCTYNEFLSYVQTGSATPAPTVYDIEVGWTFTPNSVTDIGTATYDWLSQSNKDPGTDKWTRLRDGRKSSVGIWTDMGFAVEKGRVTGATADIEIKRYLANIRGVLEGDFEWRSRQANQGLLDHLKSNLRGLDVTVVDKEGNAVNTKWQEVEWEKTIANNPDMKNPTSELFKEVTFQLNEHFKNQEWRTLKSINGKVAQALRIC